MRKTHSNKINRIEYIVRENPNGVAELLQKAGYSIPKDIPSLVRLTKGWIRKNGKPAIIQLLQVHPERQAILSACGHQEFDNFGGCGCKSSYSGGCGCSSSFDGSCGCGCKDSFVGSDRDEIIALLKERNTSDILAHYEELKELAKQYPDDQEIKLELEVTWDYLRQSFKKSEKKKRKQEKVENSDRPEKSKAVLSLDAKDLAVGSFILAVALIVAQIKS